MSKVAWFLYVKHLFDNFHINGIIGLSQSKFLKTQKSRPLFVIFYILGDKVSLKKI